MRRLAPRVPLSAILLTAAVVVAARGFVGHGNAGRIPVAALHHPVVVGSAHDPARAPVASACLPARALAGRPLLRRIFAATAIAIAVDERSDRAFAVSEEGDRGIACTLDARSGAPIRTAVVGTSPTTMALDTTTGRVFVTAEHQVATLDARSGALVGVARVGPYPFAIAVAERAGRVFVANRDHAVDIRDSRNGRLLRAVRVGREPDGAAVDARTGHVFVVNAGGTR